MQDGCTLSKQLCSCTYRRPGHTNESSHQENTPLEQNLKKGVQQTKLIKLLDPGGGGGMKAIFLLNPPQSFICLSSRGAAEAGGAALTPPLSTPGPIPIPQHQHHRAPRRFRALQRGERSRSSRMEAVQPCTPAPRPLYKRSPAAGPSSRRRSAASSWLTAVRWAPHSPARE